MVTGTPKKKSWVGFLMDWQMYAIAASKSFKIHKNIFQITKKKMIWIGKLE